MASEHNVELEAAKLLHKLIQDSKDEPARLATKLHVILQHMKTSGKENSMPYQVISRAMETVMSQHGLDFDALSPSLLLPGSSNRASSQAVGAAKDSSRPPVAPSSVAPDCHQGPVAQRSSQSFDQESPSSQSANSQSQDRRDAANWDKQVNQKDVKKATSKRKRGDTSSVVEPHADVPSQLDPRNTVNTRKGKMTKAEKSDGRPGKSGELTNFNMVANRSQMEHPSALSGSMRTMHRANQEGSNLLEKQTDLTKIGKPVPRAPNSKYPEDTEVSSAHVASGKHQGAHAKVHGGTVVTSSAYPMGEPVTSNATQYGSVLEHAGGSSTTLADGHKPAQIGQQSSTSEMTMLRQGVAPRDVGKSTVSALPESSSKPFKEQQLKQLRAQCLVFLAFRNGLAPKKLHLDIALGTTVSREGKDPIDHKGQSQSSNELGSPSAGKTLEADTTSKGTESPIMTEDKSMVAEERKHLASKKGEFEKQIQERVVAKASSATSCQLQDSSSTKGVAVVNNHSEGVGSGNLQAGKSNQPSSAVGLNKQVNPQISSWTGFASPDEASKGPLKVSTVQHELSLERRENIPCQFQNIVNNGGSRNHNSVNHLTYSLKEHWKPVPGTDIDLQGAAIMKNANLMTKHASADGLKTVPVGDASRLGISFTTEQERDERLASTSAPLKYTMSERWIMDQQKKRLLVEQNWVQRQQKAKQRMTTCFLKLKENVSASEDISAKTKSVIELKKLQLLELQRRLRSDFLNDFFKPITTELEHLKSVKKHRHGRRVKQLEKYEQKMKEERQKRIRERQKEFFSEIEVHKERLDDVFKSKRERWKGINRYVKEFHKRKERIHREKIDRIQREKINLLKINDVEGYLRMVQDAKSDRVKQLLKETEKYLQKLGSKLQDAKAAAGRFEHDVDESRSGSFLDKSEPTLENEDESDQAKHYLESNEKYYMMAHSVKESIAEQPSCLQGGKLREYQMNGLRWLVSLYNNHLNGILADEMGLGKTVQVISLICYLMETKNDRGPFLVVVPSSVLPGWESEINFWAPSILKIVYAGPPEERRRLFKERIVHQNFNVLLTTYEYLMNKHDRPKLSKVNWHYIIIDEGHRIKNASCKLNADLKHYQSSHRLLLTGTPLQNNLEELWALLNFLLPNIFNSSEDFSQWFNKPFESTGDNSPDEALLSEEENLLIINRLHQVLRPFVLRRLKHKVENELPEKIERLVRCEASAYQKLLMKRVEENLGSIGTTKARSVHNSVMEHRNICNHPYLSQLHTEEVENFIPNHYLPPIIRLCGKLEMLDRILPKLKAADHRVLFFSTMTRLLDVMEEYLTLKQHRYLRLDGHTSGGDRGALIDMFNESNSPYFIFLLSIRAGGVGVNLQAADTVIIFDTDWNPQVDLQAQARAHRIGQKKDVLVLRFETVQTVEEQVRAAAEHKLGVANQSITAGFFDNNTSAEDRREYLESLLRECKKEEAAPVLDDDALNDLLARSEAEIDIFEAVDQKRREEEMATWKKLVLRQATDGSEPIPPLPSRLVTDEDLKTFYEAMKISDVPKGEVASSGVKRKSGYLGGLDTKQYGRGKRAREVRSYEEQWTEEEFEKMCKAESPESPRVKGEVAETSCPTNVSSSAVTTNITGSAAVPPVAQTLPSVGSLPVQQVTEITPPAKRGRGRPRRITSDKSPAAMVPLATSGTGEVDMQLQKGILSGQSAPVAPDSTTHSSEVTGVSGHLQQSDTGVSPNSHPAIPVATITPHSQSDAAPVSAPIQARGLGRKTSGGTTRRRGKKQVVVSPPIPGCSSGPDSMVNEHLEHKPINLSADQDISQSESVSRDATVPNTTTVSGSVPLSSGNVNPLGDVIALNSQQPHPLSSVTPLPQIAPTYPSVPIQSEGSNRKSQNGSGAPRRRGKKQATILPVPDVSRIQDLHLTTNPQISSGSVSCVEASELKSVQENVQESKCVIQDQPSHNFGDQDLKSTKRADDIAKQDVISPSTQDNSVKAPGLETENVQNSNVPYSTSDTLSKTTVLENSGKESASVPTIPVTGETKDQHLDAIGHHSADASKAVPSVDSMPGCATIESLSKAIEPVTAKAAPIVPSGIVYSSTPGSGSTNLCPSESTPVKMQGRKTQNRVEPPRRRGKKAVTSPVVADAHAGQDPKTIHHIQNSPVDSLASKATTNVTQPQAFQILLPSGVAAHDLIRKERATSASQNKLQKVASTRIDNSPASSDKITAFGRIQNVNDVARVMKEVFSGTCSPKPKALDSVGCELLKPKATSDAFSSQCKGDMVSSDIPNNTEAASLAPDLAVNLHEKNSEGEPNNHNLEDKASSDMPTEAECLTSDLAVNRLEKQSEEASNIQTLEDKASLVMPIIGAVNASGVQSKEEDKAGLDTPTSGAACPILEQQSKEVANFQNVEGKASSDMAVTGAVHASNIQCKEDEACLDVPTTVAACLTLDVAVNRHEKQSEETSDIQLLEGKASTDLPSTRVADASYNRCLVDKAGSDDPLSGAACLTSDLAVNMHEKESGEASNVQNLDGKSRSNIPSTGSVSASNIQYVEDKAACLTSDLAGNSHEKQPEEASTIQNLGDGLDMPATEAVCLTSVVPVNRIQQPGIPFDPQVTPLHETLPNVSEAGSHGCGDVKEIEDQMHHCAENSTAESKLETLDTTPVNTALRTEGSSELCSKSSPLASCDDGGPGLLIQEENLSDQPQVTLSGPVVSSISEHAEVDSRNETDCSLLLTPIGNSNIDCSEARHMDVETSDSNRVKVIHESEVLAKNTMSDESMSLSSANEVPIQDQSVEEPVVRLMLPRSDGLDAVVNDLVDVSEVAPLVEGTVSDTEDLPPSSLIKKQNKGSFKTCLVSSSEPLEESMEKDMASSEFDNRLVPQVVSQKDMECSKVDQCTGLDKSQAVYSVPEDTAMEINNMASNLPVIVTHSVDDEMSLQKGTHLEVEISDQMEAYDVAVVNTERHLSSNTETPSSSLMMEENKMDVSCEKGPLDSLLASGESKDCTTEEGCRDATQFPLTKLILQQESINSEAEMGGQSNSQVGGISVTSDGNNLVEAFSDKGPQRSVEAQDESKGLADMENQTDITEYCAAEIATISEVPSSLASGDKVEDEKVLVSNVARMQVSQDFEAVQGDGMDVTEGCLAVPKTASVDGVPLSCSSAAVGETSEDLVPSSVAKLHGKESEAGVISQDNQALQENALKDAEQFPPSATEDEIGCSSALPETASIGEFPPQCSTAELDEHTESLSEKDLVLKSETSEAGVANQDN